MRLDEGSLRQASYEAQYQIANLRSKGGRCTGYLNLSGLLTGCARLIFAPEGSHHFWTPEDPTTRTLQCPLSTRYPPVIHTKPAFHLLPEHMLGFKIITSLSEVLVAEPEKFPTRDRSGSFARFRS